MSDSIQTYLQKNAPAGTVILNGNVGPFLFTEESPYVRGLSRSPIHDPGVVHFMKFYRNHLFPFFDVGANVGLFSVLASQMGDGTDRILAFEPDARNLEILAINLQAYAVSNVETWPVGVADKDGTITLGAINCGRSIKGKEGAVSFPARTLASIIKETGLVPAFVKIDIEGGEADALTGLFEAHVPETIIEMEYGPRDHGSRIEELMQWRPVASYRWEFVVTEADVAQLNLPAVPLSIPGTASLYVVKAEDDGQLKTALAGFDEMVKIRASRKWELCITPKTFEN